MFYFISRILFNDPPKKILELEDKQLIPVSPSDPIDPSPEIKKYLEEKDAYESPLFIIGEWGSGKTHRTLSFKNSFQKDWHFRYKTFFSVNTLEEAYSNLISKIFKLIALLFLSILNTWIFLSANSNHNYLILISVVISYGILINKLKLLYVVFNLFDCLIPKTKVTIIDDLDRSSLSESDQWAMLSNLWHKNHKYIVLLGYVGNDQKGIIIEKAEKLNGTIIFLKNDEAINCRLALKFDPNFPFNVESKHIDWLNYISPRDLIRIIREVKEESKNMDDGIGVFLYLTKLIEILSANTKLDFFDRENIRWGPFVRDGGEDNRRHNQKILRFSSKTEKSPPLSREKIRDIYDSLKPEYDKFIVDINARFLTENGLDSDFPTMFRYEMNSNAIAKMYGFRKLL